MSKLPAVLPLTGAAQACAYSAKAFFRPSGNPVDYEPSPLRAGPER